MRTLSKVSLSAVAVVAVASLSVMTLQSTAFAHSGATGVVKDRMMLMDNVGKSMKKITAMFKGTAAFDAVEMRKLSQSIGKKGGEHMTSMFPKNTLDKPSEALPVVWEKWDRFSALANQLTERANVLSDNADGGKKAMQAFSGLAKTCNDCHTDFRKKSE